MSFIPYHLYNQILRAIPIVCVDVAIDNDFCVLLVRRRDAPAKGQLWLPDGRFHKGDLLRQAAARRALDETGIECHVGPIIHTDETSSMDGPEGIAVHSVNTCFFLFSRQHSVEVNLDSHKEDSAWIDHIDPGLHPYVELRFAAAGLDER